MLNKKYTKTKKNGGNPPPLPDERVKYVPIGCQECIECRKQKARSWQVRLLEDIKTHTNGKFITLTFSNESIKNITEAIYLRSDENKTQRPTAYNLDNEIATYAVRHFLERYRKEHGHSIRHWLVTELGHNGSENIHLHGIVWIDDINEIEKHWQYGFVWKAKKFNGKLINYVTERTVNYIVKYVNKIDDIHPLYKSKILCSKGIGSNYTQKERGDWNKNKYAGTKTNEAYRTGKGNKLSLPIYYRNKIYNEEEREALWLQKLDKQTRYVLGQQVSVKKSDNEYLKILASAQRLNTQLGYGNGCHTWEEEQYERERRLLKQRQRIGS